MPRPHSVTLDRDVPIRLSDGIVTFADHYYPSGGGKNPVLLQRTPYNKETAAAFALRAAGAGYNVIVQDTRGRWASEGSFHAFRNEQQDGHDTCAWIVDQPWSNGRIGMWGGSYVGATQWQSALGRAPGLQAIVPTVTASDYHEGWCYQGGAFELQFLLSWTLTYLGSDTMARRVAGDLAYADRQQELFNRIDAMGAQFDRMPLVGDSLLADIAPYYDEWLAHPAHGEFWDKIRVDTHYSEIDIATLHTGAWYDIFLGGTLANFVGMRAGAKTESARNAQHLLIGPWEHMTSITMSPVGEYDPGIRSTHGAIDFDGIHLRWYDRHLRDMANGLDEEDPVTIFVMGSNTWRKEREWPISRAVHTDYYLHSGGRANTLNGDGKLSRDRPKAAGSIPDAFIYNPLDPVPTAGGGLCCNLVWSQAGSFDQRAIETRSDVLCYTSDPLPEPLEVTGPITVELYASSSALDTDFTAKLVDVCPCGCVRNLTDGIQRARYRKSGSHESFLTPGEVEKYVIDLWATSNLFQTGHQIRVEISSSNFPRFDRNPNHGGVNATATRADCQPAMQCVFHDSEYPTRITLPLVPAQR